MTTDEKSIYLAFFNVIVAPDTLEVLSDEYCKAIVKTIRRAERRHSKTVTFTKKSVPVTVTDENLLQHVEYTAEQCGYTK